MSADFDPALLRTFVAVCRYGSLSRAAEISGRAQSALSTQIRRLEEMVGKRLLHRTGRVPLGEASVLIAVSTPHRGEAFECCRWLIDTLKAELALWKKEVWEGGGESWARPNQEWRGGNDE